MKGFNKFLCALAVAAALLGGSQQVWAANKSGKGEFKQAVVNMLGEKEAGVIVQKLKGSNLLSAARYMWGKKNFDGLAALIDLVSEKSCADEVVSIMSAASVAGGVSEPVGGTTKTVEPKGNPFDQEVGGSSGTGSL